MKPLKPIKIVTAAYNAEGSEEIIGLTLLRTENAEWEFDINPQIIQELDKHQYTYPPNLWWIPEGAHQFEALWSTAYKLERDPYLDLLPSMQHGLIDEAARAAATILADRYTDVDVTMVDAYNDVTAVTGRLVAWVYNLAQANLLKK